MISEEAILVASTQIDDDQRSIVLMLEKMPHVVG